MSFVSSVKFASSYVVAALATVLCFASCNSGPAKVGQPSIDASTASSQAMEQYDKNSDGKIAGPELDQAAGLKAGLSRIDTDGDKAITAQEITDRINEWKRTGIGLMSFSFRVTMDGSPLPEATVTFEPESFLGADIKPASCVTTTFGDGGATVAKEDRPTPTSPPGMALGLYKVKISKVVNGKETVPAKYNQETTLGQEVNQDIPEIANNRVVYALKSK